MLISLQNINKTYTIGGHPFNALADVSINIDAGELIFVVGKSGSGKSTLLNILAGLDNPTEGKIEVNGHTIHTMTENALAKFRGENIGVIFQFFQLLPTLTVAENVMLAMDFVEKIPKNLRRSRTMELLGKVGIADQADKLPTTLSGGQQQRAAIARALANDPPIIVADEPTGNLDSKTATLVMDLFQSLAKAGKTIVLVTHDTDHNIRPNRTISIVDGRIAS